MERDGGRASLDFPVGRGDVFASNVGDGPGAAIAHHELQFALHDFDHAIDPGLAEGSQTPQEGSSNPNGFGAKREGFEYIRPPAKAAVDEYWNSVTNFGHDFRQCLNRCAQCIRGTSAVIRYEHAIDAVFDA